jgi:ADP-ribosylglycohydrolase
MGGAIGDALGAPIEFMLIDQIRSKFGETGLTDYSESRHLFNSGWSINRV